jgi:hypothetical protein
VAPPPQAAQSSSGSKEASATDGKKNEVKHVSSSFVRFNSIIFDNNITLSTISKQCDEL